MAYMRTLICISFLLLTAFNSFSQSGKAEFSFENSVIKFPKVNADTILNFTYKFTNKGTEPLIISEIKVTCGCTKPDYPLHPILPGKEGLIKVSFDTKDKFGYQDRTLEIISNAKKSPETIRFKGVVVEKKKD
jgi:hypothetical protein